MKQLFASAAIVLVSAAQALAADPAEGIWKTMPGDDGAFGHVRIYDCDGQICGVIHRAFATGGAEVESENVGKRMIWGMELEGDGSYAGGSIWAPDRDKIYRSKMSLDGNRLTVSGCIAGGLICRDQVWSRVD